MKESHGKEIGLQAIPTDKPALELEQITKRFGNVAALDSVSLSVKRGTVHALLGENGAGKTTLMRVAFGMIRPDSGTVRVKGRTVTFASPADAIRHGLGMVHQQFALIPAMSVAENVALGGRGRYRFESTAELIRSVGDRTGLWLDPALTVATLTSADRQKLEIIRSFAHGADTLILDEPTAVLAQSDANELFGQLLLFASRGGTVVLITHKLRDAIRHADEVTVLRSGRNVLTSRMDISTESTLTTAMLGQPLEKTSAFSRPPRSSLPLIVLKDVTIARNDGTDRIRNANAEVYPGEIVGVAALEGAASELLRAIAGRISPVTGSVSRPDKIGFVPEDRQRDAIIPSLSLAENVALQGAGVLGGIMPWTDIRERTTAIVDEFDIRGARADTAARNLSGGNQQRLVLGRELKDNPFAIVLENPTQGLDVLAAASIHARLRAARDSGTAIVFYSSDIDELVELSDRVLVVTSSNIVSVDADRDTIGRTLLGVDGGLM